MTGCRRGVPVQLLPSWHPVVEKAIHSAVNVPYDTSEGAPMMRLISPTYLVASWRIPGANTATGAERAGPSFSVGSLNSTRHEWRWGSGAGAHALENTGLTRGR